MKASELPHTVLQEDIHTALGLIKVETKVDIKDFVDKILRANTDIKNALRRVKSHE